MCECNNFAGYGPESYGQHHHIRCPKYFTEKHPYLMYYEESIGAWTPAPKEVENIIDVGNLEDGEDMELQFKRVDFTDAEFAAMPVD